MEMPTFYGKEECTPPKLLMQIHIRTALNDWDSVAKILLDELLKRYPDDFCEQL